MSESIVSVYDELVSAEPPVGGPILFDTACVLGGSIAGLLAARVLSDHARRVVIIERDELSAAGVSRHGVPQDQQVHTLLPCGVRWVERWLPGFVQEVEDLGGALAGEGNALTAFDGHPQASGGVDGQLLAASRPFTEARIRARVTALPNVEVLHTRATGLHYRGGAVSGVRVEGQAEDVLEADFVVDAMGRSSRLPDWLQADGYDKPRLERLETPINYASARFERLAKHADLETVCALAIFTPQHSPSGVSVAAVNAIEDQQWLVMLMGYGSDRPGTTIPEFREICAQLPEVFGEATNGAVTEDVVTYHQADSRRRHFTEVDRFPARLVSVGDAVASFNPVYGQGMSSATLHASCLSSYLTGGPDLDAAATGFFDLQRIVVDAAWAVSAGGDTARLDAQRGTEVPEDVRGQRWAMEQLVAATTVDASIARAFNNVAYMVRHPATLADPALLERAIAANNTR